MQLLVEDHKIKSNSLIAGGGTNTKSSSLISPPRGAAVAPE
jgi:hypothetical protein